MYSKNAKYTKYVKVFVRLLGFHLRGNAPVDIEVIWKSLERL